MEEKIKAAAEGGAKTVFVPDKNYSPSFENFGTEVVPVRNITEIFDEIFKNSVDIKTENILTAKEV